jgi:hypothetical protein
MRARQNGLINPFAPNNTHTHKPKKRGLRLAYFPSARRWAIKAGVSTTASPPI